MEIEKLVEEYSKTGSSAAFNKIYDQVKGMVKPHRYVDITGARTIDDFHAVARIGLYKALDSWDPEAGSTFLTWARMKMSQALIREMKAMNYQNNKTFISLNWTPDYVEGNSTVEDMIYASLKELGLYDRMDNDFDDDLYWQIVAKTEDLLKHNRRLLKTFQFKIAFPDASRELISKTLNIAKPTVSNYYEIIRQSIIKTANGISNFKPIH